MINEKIYSRVLFLAPSQFESRGDERGGIVHEALWIAPQCPQPCLGSHEQDAPNNYQLFNDLHKRIRFKPLRIVSFC